MAFFSYTCQTAWPAGVHKECSHCCPFMHRALSHIKTPGQVSRGSAKHQLFNLYLVKGCHTDKSLRSRGRAACRCDCSYKMFCCFPGDCFVFSSAPVFNFTRIFLACSGCLLSSQEGFDTPHPSYLLERIPLCCLF